MAALSALAATAALAAGGGDLPQIDVRTSRAIVDSPKVAARLRVRGAGRGGNYAGRAAIEIRGQSSQTFPKKSYAVETRDRRGENRNVPLAGMPADDDWVLYAGYNDKTLMRNVVAYAVARSLGAWAPRTRFVELRINGRHQGVYVLMEAMKLHDRRARGDALLELTFDFQADRKDDPGFRAPVTRRPILFEDREGMSRRAARRAFSRAERALYRRSGWRRRVDVASAVDFVLVQELFKNVDAFHASTYFTLTRDGRVRLGPVWDFDLSTGNSINGTSRLSKGWWLEQRPWARRLYRDRAFRQAVARRWRALRREGLGREVRRSVDRAAREVRPGVRRNFARWPVLGTRVWQNPAARGSWRAEVRFLRGWLVRRMAWMDRAMGSFARRGPR